MLAHLSIRDIVLIERLDLDFAAGLSVLTGETGAGKSILLDALTLALGGRGDASLVRHGAAQGQVTAVFDVPANHPARGLLADNAIDDDGDIILRRVQTADGRTRVFVNDQPSSVALMRDVGRALVEIHGQHDDRALVDADAHRACCSMPSAAMPGRPRRRRRPGGAGAPPNRNSPAIAPGWRRPRARRTICARPWRGLSKLDPQPGEETELAERRAGDDAVREDRRRHQRRQRDPVAAAGLAVPQLASLVRRLERKAAEAPGLLDDVLKALDERADRARRGADRRRCRAQGDRIRSPGAGTDGGAAVRPARAAARKHSVAVDDLAATARPHGGRPRRPRCGRGALGVLERAAAGCARRLRPSRGGSSSETRRRRRAALWKKAVTAELPALKLERAQFIVELSSDRDDRAAEGIDQVEFWVRTNPGTRPGPMMKVAFGRRTVALPAGAEGGAGRPRLGADAGLRRDRHGRRRRGGRRHRPAVAAIGAAHAGDVRHPCAAGRGAGAHASTSSPRSGGADRVSTGIAAMDRPQRQEEIARMLAGATITEEARAAAERLLRENAAAG